MFPRYSARMQKIFELHHEDERGRQGVVHVPHGDIATPFFMPIATMGSVKGLSSVDMESLGAQILLSNTYHLLLRPGMGVMEKAGGLHRFMHWDKPILTDSGGFQIFSLGRRQEGGDGAAGNAIRIRPPKVSEKGVSFQSPVDGTKHFLSPEDALHIQHVLGSDIMMQLDHVIGYPATRAQAEDAMERSLRWAQRSVAARGAYHVSRYQSAKKQNPEQNLRSLLFGIVQGGTYDDLRKRSVEELVKLDLDGYAIGGLAVGELEEEMYRVLELVTPLLPKNKPRYLMGVGYPHQIAEAVKRGVDMFDCVIPTREARHGRLWCASQIAHSKPTLSAEGLPINRKLQIANFQFTSINVHNARYRDDFSPISTDALIPELREYSRAYLAHLFAVGDPLALRLATLNNIACYLRLMRSLRE